MEPAFSPLDGGCACGRVRYRLTRAPIAVHACHCRQCQRMSGSGYGWNAMIETCHVQSAGDTQPVAMHTPSARAEGQIAMRCPQCMLALWTHHPLLGRGIALIAVGTLDRAESLQPTVHCYTATAQPWVRIPDDVPSYPGDYDHTVVWSAEGQARVQAALAG
jgi:hypothetical protein